MREHYSEGVEFSEIEFLNQIKICKNILDQVFQKASVFIELDYTGIQIQLLSDLVQKGDEQEKYEIYRKKTIQPREYTQTIKYTEEIGHTAIYLTGYGDFFVTSMISTEKSIRSGIGHTSLIVNILQNHTNIPIEIEEFAQRIHSRSSPMRTSKSLGRMLGRVPLINKHPTIRWSYEAFYLDASTQKDIVIYYPNNPNGNDIHRRLGIVDGYEVFGRRVGTQNMIKY
jgi:hypothetical protein